MRALLIAAALRVAYMEEVRVHTSFMVLHQLVQHEELSGIASNRLTNLQQTLIPPDEHKGTLRLKQNGKC